MNYKEIEGIKLNVEGHEAKIIEVMEIPEYSNKESSILTKTRVTHEYNGLDYTFYVLLGKKYCAKTRKDFIKFLEGELKDKIEEVYTPNKGKQSRLIIRHSNNDDSIHGTTIGFYGKPVDDISNGHSLSLIEDKEGTYSERNMASLTQIPKIIELAYEAGKRGEDFEIITNPDAHIKDMI